MKKLYIHLIAFFLCLSTLCSFSLKGQNLLGNAGFETGELTPWFGDNGNTVTLDTAAAEGEFAAIGNAAQNVDLEEGVQYELRCKAKIISLSGEEKVWIGVRGPTVLVQNARIFAMDWEDMAIDFTAPENGTYKIWIWGQGSSSYASDSWTLVVKGTSSVNSQEAQDKIKITNTHEGVSINMTNLLSEANILVHDFSGRLVYRSNTTKTNLIERDVFPASGIYVVSVITNKLHRVEKVAIVGN